jgi:hypothetical protein
VSGETEKAAARELDALGADKAALVTTDLDPQGRVNPYLLVERTSAPGLAALFPSGRVPADTARSGRVFLAVWRLNLAALRKAAADAGLADLEAKLPQNAYTLRMLAELAANRAFKPLDAAAGPAPVLVWFGAADVEAAGLLQKLFLDTPAGWSFTTELLLPKDVRPSRELKATLEGFNDPDRLAAFRKAFAAELRAAVEAKAVPNRETLDPVARAVNDLTLDLERDLRLPATRKP